MLLSELVRDLFGMLLCLDIGQRSRETRPEVQIELLTLPALEMNYQLTPYQPECAFRNSLQGQRHAGDLHSREVRNVIEYVQDTINLEAVDPEDVPLLTSINEGAEVLIPLAYVPTAFYSDSKRQN